MDYVVPPEVNPSQQCNWLQLWSPDSMPLCYREELAFIQQRSDEWSTIRDKFKVTGSSMHNALGLRTLKEQKIHFDHAVYGKPKEISEVIQEKMKYGTETESNAIATLVGVVLPFLFPDLTYVEVGSFTIDSPSTNKPLIFVSPDGCLCKNTADFPKPAIMACEFKCPPENTFKEPVYYTVPHYYVCQLLSEMAALNVHQLLFLWYVPPLSLWNLRRSFGMSFFLSVTNYSQDPDWQDQQKLPNSH
jgi:hypothetical protein